MNGDDKYMDFEIRTATLQDAEALLAIYAPYVVNTAVTFEYEVPTIEEFQKRIYHTLEMYPFLVAQQNGEIVGYAYAGPFQEREAYAWAVETSIYVKQDRKQRGIGKELYRVLEDILRLQNVLNLNACIAYPENEDEYLTRDSVCFHEHMEYQRIGEFHQCGYKFGRWYNMIWMEKHIGNHSGLPQPVKRFSEVQSEATAGLFRQNKQ